MLHVHYIRLLCTIRKGPVINYREGVGWLQNGSGGGGGVGVDQGKFYHYKKGGERKSLSHAERGGEGF